MTRKLMLKMSISVDGFVAGPNGEGDWMLKSRDPVGAAWVLDTMKQADLHIMGSRIYRDWSTFWPYSTSPFAEPMNELPKAVFSRKGLLERAPSKPAAAAEDSLPESVVAARRAQWDEAKIMSGDLAEEITKLKEAPGGVILAQGGVGFIQNLVRLGLIDEYRLVVHPVALGSGLPLFSGLTKTMDLKLISTTVFKSGAEAKIYHPE